VPDGGADKGRAAADRGHAQQKPPTGAARHSVDVLVCSERGDDAEAFGGVVQGEADDQHSRQGDLTARRGLPDRQSLGEVVQPDPDGDQQGELLGRRPTGEPPRTRVSLGRGHRSRTTTSGAGQVAVVGNQRQQTDGKAACEQCAVAEHRAETTGAVVHRRQRRVDRLPRGPQHVPEQEHQHADSGGVEHHP